MTGSRMLAALAAVLVLAGCSRGGADPSSAAVPSAESQARTAAGRFLTRYVEPDGRVVRRDQGGDTVSEGQAYGMLLTAATGDDARFTSIWSWTRAHLQQDNGLFAWRWKDGRVADPQAAADADLDMAHALVLAAQRFGRPQLRRDGTQIAAAVLANETARGTDGGRLLVAGPWAVSGRIMNPSYFAPPAYAALAATGEAAAWQELQIQALRTTRALLVAARLPPDWARADSATQAQAIASPDGRAPREPGYGFAAARLAVRFAGACDAPSRALAARLWPALSGADAALLPRRLDGSPTAGAVRHPVALVGAAGAARGAGRPADVARLLAQAADRDRAGPTYYGAAWVALGRLWLTTDLLGRCPS
jgi:hypothetical protein